MQNLYSFLEVGVVLYMLVKVIIGLGLSVSSEYPSSRLKSSLANGGIQTFLILIVIFLLDKHLPESPGFSTILLVLGSIFISKFEPIK